MPLEIADLGLLNQTAVDDAQAFIAQRLFEYIPVLDFRFGVLHDTVQHVHSVLETAVSTSVDKWTKARSLLEISADPTLADAAGVDAVLSNFRIERLEGSPAKGTVTIVLNGPYLVTIPKFSILIANSRTYTADEAYAIRLTEANLLADSDRLLRAIGDGSGRYAFDISVTSAENGVATRLRRNDRLTPGFSVNHFEYAYASSDFTEGFDVEDNSSLLSRLQDGLACQAPSNRMTLSALIRTTEAFERTVAVSEVGFGDAEQVRYHSLWPVAFGGRRDVFARTASLPVTQTIVRKATLVSLVGSGSTWQVALTRTDAPGFYDVTSISAEADGSTFSYEIISDTRSFNLEGLDYVPDIEIASEAAYTRYQTAVIRFKDPDSSLSVGATRDVTLAVRALPQIAELQDFLADRDRRPDGSDLLVRAPVPCFVVCSLLIHKRAGQGDPNLSALKATMAAIVNSTGFTGRLSSSTLIAAVQADLADGQSCDLLDMYGRIRTITGEYIPLRSKEALLVPDLPKSLVSRRTVCFFMDPEDINFELAADLSD